MEETSPRGGIQIYVAALAAAAVVATVIATARVADGFDSRQAAVIAAGVVAVVVVQSGFGVFRFHGNRSELYSYEELLYPIMLVTVGPVSAVIAFGLGSLVVNLLERKSFIKLVFNVSQFSLGAGIGGLIAIGLGGASADAAGIVAVGLAAVAYAGSTFLMFATLLSVLDGQPWRVTVLDEYAELRGPLSVQLLLGTCLALAVLAIPALGPLALVTAVVVLRMHHRWFMVSRDREQLDELLRATAELHGSLTTDEVERRLIASIFRMTSATSRLEPWDSEIPPDGTVIDFSTDAVAKRKLVVHRDKPMDPADVAICETLSRIAEVSFRMASLLEERNHQTAQLREVIEEREIFLAATAHQLRTPLTAMVGFSSLLWEQPDDPDVIKEMMAHLVGQAGEMAHHLDNLLVSSRALSDSVLIADEVVDVRLEAERAVGALAPGSDVPVTGKRCFVTADAVRVRHILRNLLMNAHQHGGQNISVRVDCDARRAWAAVLDDGPGIPAGHEETVFDSLRSGSRGSGSPEAAGLGLHVGRLLARLMGGDLVFRREDGLSVFQLELPAVMLEEAPPSQL